MDFHGFSASKLSQMVNDGISFVPLKWFVFGCYDTLLCTEALGTRKTGQKF
jgi:hypothetical protein